MSNVNPKRRLRSVPAADRAEAHLDDVLRLVARGDEDAFATFYDLTSSLVYGVILKVVRDPSMAQEVTQEVYVELWRLAPRFDSRKGAARSWTATVAHRRAVDRVRSEQARRDREGVDATKAAVAYDDVSETVGQAIEHEEVRDMLTTLTDGQREAVTLAYYGGYTYRQVAVLLDVPEGTIKTRIRDGLIKLRDRFGEAP